MKLKDSFFYTLRENVNDEDSTSSNLLVKSGMIKKSSSGTYMFMPLGLRVLRNIEAIVRQEMERAGASEVLMPSLIHQEIYEQSGRNEIFGNSIFRLKDRFGKSYVLGPTHEELFAIAGKMKVKSYKDLPFNLFQFQNKFRDEPRPRFGLIRVREFIMKDAYTFDIDLEGLDKAYMKMFNAYKNVFDRVKLDYKIVTADTGAMGGLLSEEFQAIADIGEDILVLCDNCDYASNFEITECITKDTVANDEKEIESIHTPDVKTIEQLTEFMNIDADCFVKTLMYKADDQLVACLISGDRALNETKLMHLLECKNLELADINEVEAKTNGVVGFIGPIGLKAKIIIDNEIINRTNVVTGANKKDYHYKNVSIKRDVKYDLAADIVNIKEGDVCPECGGSITLKKGIEVGNTFKLGTKYSKALKLEYLDKNNKLHPVVMGSYGIGIGRTMAAVVEQMNDENGIIWPINIAPYKVYIVLIRQNDKTHVKIAEDMYNSLMDNGIDVILDNRKERAGVKFNDADLIGIPIRITIGKKANDGLVELKLRNSDEVNEIAIYDILSKVQQIVSGK